MATQINDPLIDFSLPIRPHTFGRDYEFPEDVTRLSSSQIGAWMSRLAAYRGYVLSLLGRSDFRRKCLEAERKVRFIEKCRELDNGIRKTQTAIKEEASLDESIKNLDAKISASERSCGFYRTLSDIYQLQIDVLSREITRRQNLNE